MSSERPLADRTLVMSGGSRAADVLTAAGVTALSGYGGGDDPRWDIFLDKS
jgi:hypothetical protein